MVDVQEIEQQRLRHRLTPPPPDECVRILRDRYGPEALICTTCGTLLASEAKSYAGSNLTDEERLAYTCGERRWEAAGAARIKMLRAENLRRNMSLVAGISAARHRPTRARVERPQSSFYLSGTSSTVFRDGRAHRSGRPRTSSSAKRLKSRERSRAYRERQKEASMPRAVKQ